MDSIKYRITSIALCSALAGGCTAVDFVAEKVGDATHRYCQLSPTERATVRERIAPYMHPGEAVRIDCDEAVAQVR